MTDFDYENREKKIIARSAIHRKRGSKSKKCSLPSDHMTAKQWRERNGKVVSFSFDKPMEWDTFIQLTPETQEEYIRALHSRFGANYTSLAEMFSVSTGRLKSQMKKAGVNISFKVGHSMTGAQRTMWEDFLTTPDEVVEDMCDDAVDEEADGDGADSEERGSGMSLDEFTLRFSGELNVNEIANSLRRIFGENTCGTVEICCKLE